MQAARYHPSETDGIKPEWNADFRVTSYYTTDRLLRGTLLESFTDRNRWMCGSVSSSLLPCRCRPRIYIGAGLETVASLTGLRKRSRTEWLRPPENETLDLKPEESSCCRH